MRAIILAAGVGSRLKPHTDHTHKCLLDVGGRCILGRQIEMLLNNHVDELYIVVGYKKEAIIDYIRSEYKYLNVNFIYNNYYYNSTNNGYSLKLALDRVGIKPFLLLNSDVICHQDVIKELLDSDAHDCLAIKRKAVSIPEDMKVAIGPHGVIRIGKDIENSVGEFIGIAKFMDLGEHLSRELGSIANTQWFEKALDNLLAKHQVAMVDVTGYPSMEVDSNEDLEEAGDLFIWGLPDWEFGIRHKTAELGQRDQDAAFRLLYDVTTTLRNHGVISWINWGCLLGLYRDKSFIPWDTDIDVTFFVRDLSTVDTLVLPALQKLGCFIPKKEVCCSGDRWIIRDREKVELNWVEPVVENYVYAPGRCNLACPKHYLDTLVPFDFRDLQVFIPSNVEQYLELSYGKTWRTPLRNVKPVSL